MKYFHDGTSSVLVQELFSLSKKASDKMPKGALLVATFASIHEYLFITLTLPIDGSVGTLFCWPPMLPSESHDIRQWARATDLVRVVSLDLSEVGDLEDCLLSLFPTMALALDLDPDLDLELEAGTLPTVQETFFELERDAIQCN